MTSDMMRFKVLPEWLSLPAVAEFLGTTVQFVSCLLVLGDMEFTETDDGVRVHKGELFKWLTEGDGEDFTVPVSALN